MNRPNGPKENPVQKRTRRRDRKDGSLRSVAEAMGVSYETIRRDKKKWFKEMTQEWLEVQAAGVSLEQFLLVTLREAEVRWAKEAKFYGRKQVLRYPPNIPFVTDSAAFPRLRMNEIQQL